MISGLLTFSLYDLDFILEIKDLNGSNSLLFILDFC